MIENEILGGVSPLKARQSSRGGKYAGKATSTSKRRAGFGKSKGKRGGGGRNVGGYNAQTRFKANVWTPPASGGTTVIPTKPYAYDEEGNMEVNPGVSKGVEERTIPGEKAKKGNEFADNCYGPKGERLTGTSYYSEKKGMQIACAWKEGAKDDGSFDYDKESTEDRHQRRTYTQKEGEPIVYGAWEDFSKK